MNTDKTDNIYFLQVMNIFLLFTLKSFNEKVNNNRSVGLSEG